MLPSTGLFKAINCPFYDSGLCERPYCCFRHVKKTNQDITAVADDSDTGGQPEITNNHNFNKLVSEAVKRVLQHPEIISSAVQSSSNDLVPESLVMQVVQELKPTVSRLSKPDTSVTEPEKPEPQKSHRAYLPPVGIPQYKPTPIAELKKRHIPVPYTPLPAPRGSKIELKRRGSLTRDDLTKKTKTDISVKSVEQIESRAAYSPTESNRSESRNGWSSSRKTLAYVPSSIDSLSSPTINDYVPSPIGTANEMPDYCPSEKSNSSLEPNYVPEGSETGFNYTPTTKADLDDKDDDELDLSNEFEMIDDILKDGEENYEEEEEEEEVEDYDDDSLGTKLESKLSELTEDFVDDSSTKKKSTSPTRHSDSASESSTSKPKKEKKREKSHERKHSTSKEKDKDKRSEDKGSRSHSGHRKSSSSSSSKHKSDSKKHKNRTPSSDSASVKEKSRSSSSSKHSSVKRSSSKHSSSKHSGSKHSSSKSHSKSHSSKGHHHSDRDKKRSSEKHESSKRHSKESSKSRRRHSSDSKAKDTDNESEESDNETSSNGQESPAPAEEDLLVSTDFESDKDEVEKECMRIFQEYEPSKNPSKEIKEYSTPKDPEVVEEEAPRRKKRVAHEGAEYHPPKVAAIPKRPPNPMQVMAMRFNKLKEEQEKNEVVVTTPSHNTPSVAPSNAPAGTGGRIRIAHVPNVSMLLSAKDKIQEAFAERRRQAAKEVQKRAELKDSIANRTVIQTVPKGGQRMAHKPSTTVIAEPRIIGDSRGAIPTNSRQGYLRVLIKEYMKICNDMSIANEKSVEEEAAIYERSTTRTAYTSNMSSLVNRLRREKQLDAAGPSHASLSSSKVFSHSAILAGRSGRGKGSWSVQSQNRSTVLKLSFYEAMMPYILTDEQLTNNGYPRPHPTVTSGAIVHLPDGFKRRNENPGANIRKCCRCGKEYRVNKDGFQINDEECIHHWGRCYDVRSRGNYERQYSCCSGFAGSHGCAAANYHVNDCFDPDNLRGFVKTLPNDDIPPEEQGVYAVDCEMCYTTQGLELTRVTFIDKDMEVVYETLVKPKNPIIDYNTRFSGITEEAMEGVTTDMQEVWARIMSFVHSKTILIGHSLESDLKALKLIHDTVVDTSVVFPHRAGPPKKRALKNIAKENINMIIQENLSGHDSREDAMACMALMLWKVNRS